MRFVTKGRLVSILLLILVVCLAPTAQISAKDRQIYNDYTDNGMGNSPSASKIADQIAYGVISCVSVGVLILMAYMTVFGRRMISTAQRWHVLNISLWGILHLVSYASFAEKAPWPNFITNQDWRKTSKQVECITRSVFPAGMIFVFIEQIILTIAPTLANSFIFNTIFFILLIPLLNGLLVFLYYAHFMEVVWFYEPADLFNLGTYVLFGFFTLIYFIFCLFGTCLCCSTMTSKKEQTRTMSTYADMWLLLPYSIVPMIMYGPSFGMTSVAFVLQYMLTWVMESGLLGGGGSTSEGSFDMSIILQLMTNAILAMPWFVLILPLVQTILSICCLRMFREQFFFTLSCGRVYEGKRLKIGQTSDEWNSSSVNNGPPPGYLTQPAKKVE